MRETTREGCELVAKMLEVQRCSAEKNDWFDRAGQLIFLLRKTELVPIAILHHIQQQRLDNLAMLDHPLGHYVLWRCINQPLIRNPCTKASGADLLSAESHWTSEPNLDIPRNADR